MPSGLIRLYDQAAISSTWRMTPCKRSASHMFTEKNSCPETASHPIANRGMDSPDTRISYAVGGIPSTLATWPLTWCERMKKAGPGLTLPPPTQLPLPVFRDSQLEIAQTPQMNMLRIMNEAQMKNMSAQLRSIRQNQPRVSLSAARQLFKQHREAQSRSKLAFKR